jgi:23S rRNA (guanosine2251-2'-O)-methyltransferase
MTPTTETLYGIHPVLEALKARRRKIFRIFIATGRISGRIEPVVLIAETLKVPVEYAPSDRIETLSASKIHQGVCAAVSRFPYDGLPVFPEAASSGDGPPFWVVADSIHDPRNLGALIRTALCVGVDGIIIAKDRSAPATPAVSKASAGALEHTRLIRVTNLVTTLAALKAAGVWVAGLDGDADQSLFGIDLKGPLALVIGGEEKGIRPLVKKHCDFLVAIPHHGPVNSLNASVAGAVAMYEAYRQRFPGG